jgi:hypothetical protein
MQLKWIKGIFLFLFLLIVQDAPFAIAQIRPLTESYVKQRIQQAVDREHLAPGIVVGFVDEQGSWVEAYGKCRSGAKKPVNGDTLFEIGSITKVFTALLLQDMVDRGEVKLEDPIGKFLPAGLTTPSRNGKQITLVDLALSVNMSIPSESKSSASSLWKPLCFMRLSACMENMTSSSIRSKRLSHLSEDLPPRRVNAPSGSAP